MKNSVVFLIDGKQSKNRIRNLEAKICSALEQSVFSWLIYITKSDQNACDLISKIALEQPKAVVVNAQEQLIKQVNYGLRNTKVTVWELPMTKNCLILQKISQL